MTRFLLATASVHTTAAVCDYLADRGAPGDEVVALSVVDGEVGPRDAGDALNVVSVRLPGDIETVQREGEPGAAILALAADRGVDEIVIGARRGDPDATADDPDAATDDTDATANEPGAAPGGLGSTAGTVLASADRPVVVLPSATPDATIEGV